ncbi:MAG: winged helix-turn-helix transcriptional regulator [Thermoplasmata archaeon]
MKERETKSNRPKILLFLIALASISFVQFLVPNAEAQPSINLTMGLSAQDVEPGDVLTCTIFFNNTGTNNSTSAWINVSVPLHMSYLSDTSFVEGGSKTGDYNWTFSDVNVSFHSFDIDFLILDNASDGEVMTISANLDYLDQFFSPMPPSSTFETVTARRPVLLLGKIAETYRISPGQTHNYTITFQNTGSRNASLVLVNDFLPPSLIYINDTSSSIGGTKVGPYNWSFSDVTGSLSFDLTVQAMSSLSDGMLITNTVTLQYRNVNGVWFQEIFESNTTMVVIPALTFQKTVDKTFASPGDLLEYTLTVNNTGRGTAKTVVINDTLPNDTRYFSSSPMCDSIIGNTCSWTLYDLAPGTFELLVQTRINDSVPGGSRLTNDASLNYTNSKGVPLGNLSSNASTVIEQTYLVLVLGSRVATSTPNDFFEFDVLIRNTSPLPSLAAWLNITFPGEVEYISDNATDAGGTKTSNYRWEFANVPQGDRSFIIITRISSETTDMQALDIDLQLDHTNERGESFPTASDRMTITVHSPILSSQIVSTKRVFEKDETLAFAVFLNNTGSVPSQSAWLNLSIPSSLTYLSDTSASIGGTAIGNLSYVFSDIGPGNYEFQIFLSFEGALQDSEQIEVWAFLNYTDSNGDFIGEYARNAVCQIVAPSGEFPFLLAGIVILFACMLSFAGLFSRESTKYSLLLFFLPLYSRLRRKEVLDHETRGMIRGYVIANPGDHFNSIKSALDLRNGTLAHHLHVLEREDIIKSIKDGKYRRFFPTGMRIPERAYPTRIEQMILDIVKGTPGITQKDIASQLRMSQPTVSYHINKLKKSDRIRTEKHGMSLRHYLTDSEQRVLDRT